MQQLISNNKDNTQSKTQSKKIILTDQAKKTLVNELLKVHMYNKQLDEMKHNKSAVITNSIITAQKSNISDLVQENKMLKETLKKYKTMYHDLQIATFNTPSCYENPIVNTPLLRSHYRRSIIEISL
jgi:hypothetical protein